MEFHPEPLEPKRLSVAPAALSIGVALGVVAVLAALILLLPHGARTDLGLTAGADPTPTPAATDGPGQRGDGFRGFAPGFAGNGWVGPDGGGRGFGGVLGQISITAINGSSVSLKSATGWTRTIDVSGVTIKRAGSTITVGGLQVGDHVVLGESRASEGSYTLTGVTVVLDRVAGVVTTVDATSITVRGPGGGTSTVTTSASTVYRRAGQTIARGDIAAGERITATGKKASDGLLAAEAIDVQPDVVFGTVIAKSGSTLTVSTAGGGTATVMVTSATTYRVAGKASATIDDIAVNDGIMAQGVLGSDGSLTASSIRAGTGHGFGGMFGPGDFGKGWGPGPETQPAPTATSGTSG